MTARSSTGNFSKFGTYFLYKLRTLRPLIILISIFSLLSYPLLLGFFVPYMHVYEKLENFPKTVQEWESGSFYRDPDYIKLSDTADVLSGLCAMALVIAIIMLAAIFIMSLVITRKNFRWLYNKTIVDMDYSLPISDDTRILGDLLSAFCACVVPHLLAIGISRIIAMFRPNMKDEAVDFLFTSGFYEQVTFSGLFACVMLMAYVLFVIAICGRKAETSLYPIVIAVAVPIIHAVCLWLAYSDVYGYQFASSPSDFNSISYTSPLGFIFMSFMYVVEGVGYFDVEEYTLPLFRAAYGIPAIIVTVGLFVAAYFLIKNRRAERVGQPFVFNAVKFIIPAIVIFTVVSPFMGVIGEMRKEEEHYGYTPHYEGLIIAMIIVTFVMYVIMELISGKGFRRFHITLVKYIATMGLSVLVCIGLWNAHGFGIGNYVPDADKVQSVDFNIRNRNVNGSYFRSSVSELENIEAITAAHEVLPKKKETDSTDRYISLTYNMKNGDIVEREYYLTRTQYNDWMDAVLTSEAFYNNIVQDYLYDWDGDETITEIEFAGTGNRYETKITGVDLLEALRNDCDNASFEQLFGSGTVTFNEIIINYVDPDYSYRYGGSISVRDWMTETIALLREHGIVLGSTDTDISTSKYSTAFLVEYPIGSGGYFDTIPAYIMCGDDSLSDDELMEYGYYPKVVFSGNLPADEVYEDMYGYNSYDEYTDMYVVDFRCVRLDMESAEFDNVIEWCSDGIAVAYNEDKIYSLVLVSSENAADYIYGRDISDIHYYINDEYYDDAQALFAKLAA